MRSTQEVKQRATGLLLGGLTRQALNSQKKARVPALFRPWSTPAAQAGEVTDASPCGTHR